MKKIYRLGAHFFFSKCIIKFRFFSFLFIFAAVANYSGRVKFCGPGKHFFVKFGNFEVTFFQEPATVYETWHV